MNLHLRKPLKIGSTTNPRRGSINKSVGGLNQTMTLGNMRANGVRTLAVWHGGKGLNDKARHPGRRRAVGPLVRPQSA